MGDSGRPREIKAEGRLRRTSGYRLQLDGRIGVNRAEKSKGKGWGWTGSGVFSIVRNGVRSLMIASLEP